MLFNRNKDKTKIISCPRCGYKMLDGTNECPDCGLDFSRFEIATNKEAKAKKRRGDRDFIINTKKLPSDVSYVKLLLFTIFLGAFGGHCFYVGRHLRGSILVSNFVVLILAVIFSNYLSQIHDGAFIASISTVIGLIELMWFWDIFTVATKRFKVPVAIDVEGDILKQKKEYMESLKELNSVEEGSQRKEFKNELDKDTNNGDKS